MTKLLRRVRLIYGTWRAKVLGIIEGLGTAYRQRTCPHSYRAALVEGEPGKVCQICDAAHQLTREEFFAQFGEKYMGMIGGPK